MLHAPVNENKTQDKQSKTQSEPESESQNRALGWAGYSSLGLGGEGLSQQGKDSAQGWQPISLSPLSQGGILQRKCACGNSAGSSGACSKCQSKQGEMLQTKLRISKPGDKYEQEADLIAERVMQISDSQASLTQLNQDITVRDLPDDNGQKLDRQSMENEEVEEIIFDDMNLEENDEDIEPDETGMPKRENGSADLSQTQISSVHIPREEGHLLKEEMRNFMEPRFGYDFGKVRIHTNTASVKSAQKLNARAYTMGENIYFNEGQYTSNTYEGRKLLAHELTHVIQQLNPTSLSKQILQKQPSNLPQKLVSTKKSSKSSSAGGCPQGKQEEVVRDDCQTSEPENKDRYITNLNVSLSSQTVEVVWSDKTKETWICSPNPKVTPTGKDVVGVKCSVRHTNLKKDGMAWFTGFDSESLRIGFHDSQRVGKGIHSHGCVRVSCDKAEIINKNSWSGKTAIEVVK